MKEIRTAEIRAEAPAGANSLTLTGRPIVYDVPTTINDPAGKFTEIIRRGALDGADLSDVRLMFGHDTSRVPLARTPKTMRLSLSPAGLDMEAELPDTAGAREVHTAVKRGDLSGMSFAFKVPPGGDSYDRATNTRTIHKIAKVLECSVVPFPAYPQTSVEARAAMQPISDDRRQALLAVNKLLMKEF
jgi:HK97 family phage prohead protease